jgi:uncharacterized cupin superfamily protein
MARKRPFNLVNWADIEAADEAVHPGTLEKRGFGAWLSGHADLSRLGVSHERLPPGRRSSPPHAEHDDEEMIFILEGTPDLWQDGRLYRLSPGVAVGWKNGTGVSHCLINNSTADVRYLVAGEVSTYRSRAFFPHDPLAADFAKTRGALWTDPPKRRLGPHDGTPGPGKVSRALPENAVDWRKRKAETGNSYPGSKELLADFVRLSGAMGLGRIGGGIDILPPGRRTSWPHAERDEEEFVFVIQGAPTLWQDGHVWPMRAGDFAGWRSGTGVAHTILNDSDEPAILFTFGEASRARGQVHYPLHPARNRDLAKTGRHWSMKTAVRVGPHDGKPKPRGKRR